MTLINPAYCTLADMERKFSEPGVTAFADHDESGTADTGVVDDSINQATDEINLYCQGWYTPARLATSPLINRWATLFACIFNCENRGNPVPDSFLLERERIMALLERILSGTMQLPGIPLRADMGPSFSNLGIDRRYAYRKVRVKPNSNQAPTMLRQDKTQFPPVAE